MFKYFEVHTSARFEKEKRKGSKASKKGNKDKENGGKGENDARDFLFYHV